MGGEPAAEVAALRAGRAFVRLRDWRVVAVSGADAVAWLHDLLTADIEGTTEGHAHRSLLLTPTGRIRADVHVVRRAGDVLLLQRRDQPERVDDILTRYRLSSDVHLAEADLAVFAIPNGAAPPTLASSASAPSALGPGTDVLVDAERREATAAALERSGLHEVGEASAEALRIVRGDPRMGVDFGTDSLPAETGLDAAIDASKGCFLGQESVAKVRNLGHPRRVLRHVRADGPVRHGEPVLAGAARVGEVTSATLERDASVALIRVGWDAREAGWTLRDGRPLRAVPPPT